MSNMSEILKMLRTMKTLTKEEMTMMQNEVNRLESLAAARATHHDTTTHHHTSALAGAEDEE